MNHKRPFRKRLKYFCIYLFVRFLIPFSWVVPRDIWLMSCALLAKGVYYFIPVYRQRVIRNLQLAFASTKSKREIDRLAKSVYVMLGKNAGDIIRSFNVKTIQQFSKFVTTHDMEHYYKAHAKGKGVIVVTCHLGAFELQAMNAALQGIQLTSIATPLKDENLNGLLHSYRCAYGATIVAKGKEIFKLMRVLKRGESVAMLIDQDTDVKSEFVHFMGKPAYTPVGAAVLAMKTGASVVPSYIYMDKNHKHHHRFFPEIPIKIGGEEKSDVIHNIQNFTAFIEEQVHKHPEQWVWMHERWKTQHVTTMA